MDILQTLVNLWEQSGFALMFTSWQNMIMVIVACVLLYLAIVKKFEPLLLVCIAFGMLLANLPLSGLYNPELFAGQINIQDIVSKGGLFDLFILGVKLNIYPCLIFMGIGAMTDFGPLIAQPLSLLLGGCRAIRCLLFAFLFAHLLGFTPAQAASIGIIGGADGPTAIFLTSKLAPELLGPIAIAAYSYMALIR